MEENLQKETQAERLVKNLAEKKMRIAAAEAGSGGMFSQSLSAVPGAAAVFRCGVAAKFRFIGGSKVLSVLRRNLLFSANCTII